MIIESLNKLLNLVITLKKILFENENIFCKIKKFLYILKIFCKIKKFL